MASRLIEEGEVIFSPPMQQERKLAREGILAQLAEPLPRMTRSLTPPKKPRKGRPPVLKEPLSPVPDSPVATPRKRRYSSADREMAHQMIETERAQSLLVANKFLAGYMGYVVRLIADSPYGKHLSESEMWDVAAESVDFRLNATKALRLLDEAVGGEVALSITSEQRAAFD